MSRLLCGVVRSHQRPRVGRRRSSSLVRSQQRPEALAAPLFTPEFYESEAAVRRYYYYVDLQGALFLDEHSPKGVTTSLKDGRFLDFFFSRLKPGGDGGAPLHAESFPWLSPCGREHNLVRCADTPVVFTALTAADGGAPAQLRYGSSLRQAYRPELLRACQATGRLYHMLETGKLAGGYALLQSALVQAEFAQRLCVAADGRFSLVLEPDGREHRLEWLRAGLFHPDLGE